MEDKVTNDETVLVIISLLSHTKRHMNKGYLIQASCVHIKSTMFLSPFHIKSVEMNIISIEMK